MEGNLSFHSLSMKQRGSDQVDKKKKKGNINYVEQPMPGNTMGENEYAQRLDSSIIFFETSSHHIVYTSLQEKNPPASTY